MPKPHAPLCEEAPTCEGMFRHQYGGWFKCDDHGHWRHLPQLAAREVSPRHPRGAGDLTGAGGPTYEHTE